MSMPKGSLQRAPWCRGLLVMKRHGAGVQVACVAGLVCMVGQAVKANSEGGATMLRYLEARSATDVCVCVRQIRGCNKSRSRGTDRLCITCVSSTTGPKIEDEDLQAVRDYRSVLVNLDPADVIGFLAAAEKAQDLL